jgi:antirestriction protein ArdC
MIVGSNALKRLFNLTWDRYGTTRPSKKTPHDIIAEPVINALREAIERGDNGQWSPPWRRMTVSGIPLRENGEAYRGINTFLLSLAGAISGYSSPYWLTSKSAKRHGGSVKTSEYHKNGGRGSTPICFYKSYNHKDKETGEAEQRRVMRFYSVYNADQCEGLPSKYYPATDDKPLPNGVSNFDALTIIKSVGVPVETIGDKACYIPSTDKIRLPAIERFESNAGFSGTALHELTHATGHKSRLARDFSGRFGDASYATEELVAEFGATILCATFGLEYKLEHHASYLELWHRTLKSNPKILATAGAAAQKAAQYVLDITNQKEMAA